MVGDVSGEAEFRCLSIHKLVNYFKIIVALSILHLFRSLQSQTLGHVWIDVT